MDKILNVNLS